MHVLVDHRLDNYLTSKGSDDWFITKHCPSTDECSEFQQIVLDNLLRKTGPCLLSARIADIYYLQPMLNPLFEIGICGLAVFLVQIK